MVAASHHILKYLTMAEVPKIHSFITTNQNIHSLYLQILEELRRIKDIGLPITAINLITYLRSMVSVVCMGRQGRAELAGVALAVGFTNITGYSVLSGLATGMDPLCSQAFGSRNLPLIYRTLRRAILLLLLVSIPIAFLWLNIHPLMLRLGQDPAVSAIAGRYCLFALPDLLANSLLHPLRSYLRSRGTPTPMMWSMSLSLLIHLPLTFFLSSIFGVSGVAIATFTTNFTTLLFLLAYATYSSDDHLHPLSAPLTAPATAPPSSEWAQLLQLAIPSCLGVCLEWWWYELMTLVAGYLANPHVSLAAAAIVIQTTSLMYTLPTTLSATVSARVGNELGAGRPARARATAIVAVGLAFAGSCLGLTWTTLGREAWGRVFTQDEEVLELTNVVLPVIGLCELANCPQTTGCGVLRGSARPGVGAVINFYSFYLVGAPVALVLAFGLNLGFTGLCFGLLAAQVVCALSVLAVAFRTDWEEAAQKAQSLVGREEAVVEDGCEDGCSKELNFHP